MKPEPPSPTLSPLRARIQRPASSLRLDKLSRRPRPTGSRVAPRPQPTRGPSPDPDHLGREAAEGSARTDSQDAAQAPHPDTRPSPAGGGRTPRAAPLPGLLGGASAGRPGVPRGFAALSDLTRSCSAAAPLQLRSPGGS